MDSTHEPTGFSKNQRRRVKVVDEIIESLRQDIVTRRLPDGERLPSEKELSVRFGVSQPTVREAIRALETLGLIEVAHGKGTFVRSKGDYALASALQTLVQLENVSIMEVLSLRQVLGLHSIDHAVNNATAEDLDAIEQACTRLEHVGDVNDVDQVITNIIDFQRAVSTASHSSLLQSLEIFLLALLHAVQSEAHTGQDARFWRVRASEFQPHRIAILEGLRAKDAAMARKAMESYFTAQSQKFDQDDKLHNLNMSGPSLINIVSDMVRQFKV